MDAGLRPERQSGWDTGLDLAFGSRLSLNATYFNQYANDLTWSGGPGVYLALQKHYTLALQCVVSGETKGKDTFSGVDDDDSAETIVYVGPQVNFTWRKKLAAQAGLDIPVSIDNTGVQLVPNYRAHVAVTWRF